MAAKPPKPPGNVLKPLPNQHNSQNQLQHQQNHNNGNNDREGNSSEILFNSITAPTAIGSRTLIAGSDIEGGKGPLFKENNCNCSNITIMHLFHEMKQEFPTIPDTIVAQCVNENCHQRENCIQMLKNELELNPIPAQSYPAKVLHPRHNQIQNCNNHNNSNNNNSSNSVNNTTITKLSAIQKPPLQQKPLIVQQKPPLKPIKPTRTAPLHPPFQQNNNINNNTSKINSTIAKNITTTNKPLVGGEDNGTGLMAVGSDVVDTNDMPKKAALSHKQSTLITTANTINTISEVNNNGNGCGSISVSEGDGESVERNIPRQRPTTLNLNTQLHKQQQEQRQRLNIQLQQRFQEQRNRQLQQPPTKNTNTCTNPTKPIRKAPLPPIAAKSTQLQFNRTTNCISNDSHLSNHTTTATKTATSPLSESEISVCVSLSTPSPTSSLPLSNNTTQHNTSTSTPTSANQQHLQTKSPIRHRSVITLQPEPPYTRGFLFSPTTSSSPSLAAASNTIQTTTPNLAPLGGASSPTASGIGSQKSFTSVNLTLRPPVSPTGASSALQPSTIDITAGPGFSGASGGGKSLHYSSTSYDARLGYQQNFQITVTDEGGVFSACRIRPQQQQLKQRCVNQVNISDNQYDGNSSNENKIDNVNCVNSSFFNEKHKQLQQHHQQQQQFHNNNVVALQQNIQNSIQSPLGLGGVDTTVDGNGNSSGGDSGMRDNKSGNMSLSPQQTVDDLTVETLQRQKKRRDRLAEALRARKKTLSQVEQDINLLIGNIPTDGLSERLDDDIRTLRKNCEAMFRNSSNFKQSPSQQELAINHQPQQQQQPQPFPRQRLTRPPPRPPPPRQTSLDIIQHHSPLSTPHTPPATISSPNLNFYNTTTTHPQQQSSSQQSSSLPPSSYYHQQLDHDDLVYDNEITEGNDDDYEYEEMVEPWECNMCTFRNHPQLNICETCENVRILPGTLPNLSRALSATNCTNTIAATAILSGRINNATDNNNSIRRNDGLSIAN